MQLTAESYYANVRINFEHLKLFHPSYSISLKF
jgi:hypothetical protein